ncbi:MAG TPA: hypothetical protein DD640_04295 [Clostridiales bacterium]|nr:hypothetical protein [Clostridiales bacterium]
MRSTREQTDYILHKMKERTVRKNRIRNLRTRWLAAASCLALVAGIVVLKPFLFNSQVLPAQTTTTAKSGQSGQTGQSASMIALLTVDGIYYRPVGNTCMFADDRPVTIIVGREIGTVEMTFGERDQVDLSSYKIYSNYLDRGAIVYEWSGYSREFRVCAEDRNGELIGFERFGFQQGVAAGTLVGDVFDFTGQVVQILICNDNPTEIGRISDPDTLDELMGQLSGQARFMDNDLDINGSGDAARYRLYLRLNDNSVTELLVYPETEYGSWIGPVSLPAGFAAEISRHIITSASLESLNYGNLYADIDYYREYSSDGPKLYQDYCIEPVWVDGNTGNLYMGMWKDAQWQWLIADDAQGDIRIEGQYVYYLNRDGAVARLRFVYEQDEASLYDLAASGADLSGYVTERDIIFPGEYARLQVRQGDLWTLGPDGNLCCNGDLVAGEVRAFVLDAGSVIYSDDRAIWRQPYAGGAEKLADTKTGVLAAAGVNLYFSPDEGGIWSVRADGSDLRQISAIAASKLVYREQTLAALDRSSGEICLIYRDKYFFNTGCLADDMDLGLYQRLYYFGRETGSLQSKWFSIEREGAAYKLYLD